MKFRIKVQAGGETRDHALDVPLQASAAKASQGALEYFLDNEHAGADWAEILPGVYSVLLDGRSYEAQVARLPGKSPLRSARYNLYVSNRHYTVEVQDARLQRAGGATAAAQGPEEILAPMPGRIVKVLVAENQQVSPGQGLLVIEAMKMQNELRAPRPGRVEKIHVSEGVGVETGSKLLRLV
jgi:biotin carboxyl carrier protein